MDSGGILEQLDRERRTLARDDEIIEVLPEVTRLRPADGAFHAVVFSALAEATADAAIARQVGHYRCLGAPFEWKVYSHDRPSDLLDRLARQGFRIEPIETVLVLDLAAPPRWVGESPPCEVVRVQTAGHVRLFRDAAAEIFSKDYDVTAGQLQRAIDAGSRQHVAYLAMMGGVAAAVGRLYTHSGSVFGGLYGGGTRPSFRGRGLYRALIAARARAALASGARYLIVDALPTSRPILERVGFTRVADTWPCTWTPPTA